MASLADVATFFASLVFRVKMRIIFFPSFVKPEPLVWISANHIFYGVGDELSVCLDVGAQITGPFEL